MKKMLVFALGLLMMLVFSVAADCQNVCNNDDVWTSDCSGNPVEKLAECGDGFSEVKWCQNNSLYELFNDKGCRDGSCFSEEQVRLLETCGTDGCYNNEYRAFTCSLNGCSYTVVKAGDSDNDGIDDKCDTCIDKNKNGICAGQDECDTCMGQDQDSPILSVFDCIVQVNGREVEADKTIYKVFERGETVDMDVELVSQENAQDVQIEALILGYDHGNVERDDISDITDVFDVKANRSYNKALTLKIPEDIEKGDLKIRLIISDRFHTTWVKDYNLDVNTEGPKVIVKDIILTPEEEIVSGRSLIGAVRVKNLGNKAEESVKVKLEIPKLDLSDSTYLDELQPDDSETTDDFYFRLPDCVDEGNYTVRATVTYDDDYEETVKDFSIIIRKDSSCDGTSSSGSGSSGSSYSGSSQSSRFVDKTVITITGSQDVITGTAGAVYPIMISNGGQESKTYVITVKGVDDFGTSRIDPSAVVVIGPGKTEVPYLYITAKEGAISGQRPFTVEISYGSETKQIALTANVVKGASESTSSAVTGSVIAGFPTGRAGFEVILLALLVVVILGGLMYGFSRLKEK